MSIVSGQLLPGGAHPGATEPSVLWTKTWAMDTPSSLAGCEGSSWIQSGHLCLSWAVQLSGVRCPPTPWVWQLHFLCGSTFTVPSGALVTAEG